MGQAKARGDLQARIAAAQARQLTEEPINIECRTCGEILNGFTLLQHTPVGAAWQKTCACGAITTAMVQGEGATRERAFRATLGMAPEIAGPERKVDVAFLPKGVDTIETGLIRL